MPASMWEWWIGLWLLLEVLGGTCLNLDYRDDRSCNRSRQVMTGSWGVITDGPKSYPEASHCQWLIRGQVPGQHITLNVTSIDTECSYDHLYIYDGETYNSPKLGVFSGNTVPPPVTASSGSMLILLYSDTNYVLDGFVAEYSITDCPLNCSSRGICKENTGTCVCDELYTGSGCEYQRCPENCGFAYNRGHCSKPQSTSRDPNPSPYCLCNEGYFGDGCSLSVFDNEGGSWYWVWHGGDPLHGRASHASVYLPHTDQLYLYGGYDLNNILGDLLIFDFNTSVWVNVSDPASQNQLSRRINSKITARVKGMTEQLNVDNSHSTLLRNITFSVNSNNTVSVKLKNLMGETSRKKRMIRPSEELNHTPASQSVKGINPGPRYGHVMEAYDRHFVLFGGKLPSGEVSNELWLYNTTLDEWRLLEGQQDNDLVTQNENTPPGLMHATLTLVDGSWLYLFGGSLEHGEFSSRMYRINLEGGRIWERVIAKGGNEHEARVVGHSAVFHAASRSLLIYGGIRVDVPRFSKLSDRLLVFDVDKHYWSQIHYPQEPKEESQVPLERAFHTAVIAGNYMVVFGGYLHKHKKEEKCYDDKLYLYHLGCHTWVSEQLTLTTVSGTYPKGQGIYGHTAFLRDGNTMVVVAGFHGSVSSHVLAYVLPSTLVSATGRELDMDEACRRHDAEGSCVSNLECGWCPADKTCYERSRGANCTNNLQTSQCPGICPSLHFCQSCTIHGRLARRSPCAWCVQTGKCHEQVETSGAQIRCGSPDDNPLGQEGWWGPTGDDLVSPQECRLKNFAPGITFIRYRHPVNFSRPDAVVIKNTTKIELRDYQEFKGAREFHAGGTNVARLLGFIHPEVDEDKKFLLNVNTSGLNASVKVSLDDTEEKLEELELVDGKAQRPGRQPIFPSASTGRRRYLTNVTMNQQISPSNNKNGMISITCNAHTHSAMELNIVALEPYSNGGASCSLQNTCLACLTDAKCGWCGVSNKCVDRRDMNLQCKAVNTSNFEDPHFFTLTPEHCVTCEQHIYCDDCVGSGECEWLPDEAYCSRKGRFPGRAVMEVGKCPAPCHKRKSCASCLGDPGRCAWCQETKECFLFSVYTSVYQYGSCRVWLDEDHTNVTSPLLTTAPSPAEDPEVIGTTLPYLSTSVPIHTTSLGSLALDTSECHLCESLQGCDACLKSLDCGWCYNVYNPTIGICTAGDFSSPSRGGCDALVEPQLQAAIDNSSFMVDPQADWAYAVCPDVDECKLNLHNCHPNATCTNTHPGFNCTCKRGFKENSQGTCERTCNETCHYGHCSGPPDYQCLCHLGWTGSDCATNCECNNHSTCNISVGICDQCQDWTTGDFCHLCKPGSYGNATTKGCERCNCNDHSNESLGRCNQDTGQCHCIDNTHGRKCEKCLPGFYGDPRNGGRCYRKCSARNILYNAEEGNLGAQIGGLVSRDCLWIITPHDSLEPLPPVATGRNVIQISIEDINIDCEDGILYIYDGLPDFVSRDPRWDRPSRILGAFCAHQALYPVTVQSTSGFMTIYYKKNKALQGFNASYEVLQCTDNAGDGRICENEKPMCKDNFSGVHCDVKICPNRCSETEGKGSCDEAYGRCKCAAGFVGEDCSIVQQGHHVVVTDLFVPDKISYSLSHLTKVLPRMGHSMVVDHLDSLWIFGGYSLSRGPLNDIRQFDTGNKTWVQLTVNVEVEDKPPPSRYFHAAAYVVIHREMYVYGGLNQTDFLGDFWRFNFETESWKRMETHPELPPLAGHTLTYRNDAESQSLVLIGGASSSYGFSDQVWEYNLRDGQWHKVETRGARPLGIYGHSTVYHKGTKTFYVHGGHSFKVERVGQSSDLYALDYNQKKWSVLPTDHRINHNPASLPAPRSFHSAITTEDYMVVIGGHITDHLDSNQGLLVYSYKCNMWIPLNNRFITLVGPEIVPYIGTSAAIHGSSIYIFGGYFGTPQGSMTEITIPTDLCTLNANKTQCRDRIGCANCVVYESERTNTSYCYSNTKEEPGICQSPPKGKSSVVGVRCDKELLEKHDCYQHTSCTECLAEWPAHPNSEQGCQWCFNCSKGKCIPRENNCSEENYCDSRDGGHGVFIIDSDKCYENACQASDCDKCLNLRSECIWTRQVKQTSELDFHLHVKPKYNWNCVKETIKRHLSYVVQSAPPEQCPWRCHHHTTCTDCLNAEGAEGGWQECRWSPSLQQCFSPSFVTLRCVGGACGAVLSEGSHMCPKPCEKFTMCASCLANPHCGWCAQDSKITGVGICTEGLLEGPLHGTCQDHINRSITNTSLTSPAPHRLRHNNHVSWHYDVCPPEDECKNMHHTCDQKSQQCVDQTVGFECICALGYNQTEDGRCSPVCSQGCLAGTCIEPNNCSCNFGYVGGDCSIKCECNGHSECAGEDQLNVCLKCHNNTMGERCEKCKPNFVGDPSNGGQCKSCFDYCNKHTNSCVAKEVFEKAISSISFYSSDKNISESDPGILNIFKFLNSFNVTEGAVSEAVCLACGGNTTKAKCADCLPGFFRGTQDLSQPCRPCQCNGHGTKCDQVWGTKCNCGNNTESVCSNKGRGAGTEKEDEKVCWQQQCSKCKESYLGNPSNGHQCFMQMGVEKEYCLDPHTQNNCKTKPTTLRHGQTVYFAVQPKFMNVDIRLILDITKGGADVYFSSREDTFVVSVNQTTWQHKVTIDSNYPIAKDEAPLMYTAPVKRNYVGTGFDLFDFSGFTINHKKEMVVNKTQQSVTEYHLIEKTAVGLKTFATVSRSSDILIVRNVSNRLVITLPQNQHDLKSARFYVIVYGIGTESEVDTHGSIFFRQDQPRIDLFVFFSVFFSCFFLFLAVCVVVWKIKQGVDIRRARRRHVVEMQHMAKRPFADTTLVLHAEDDLSTDAPDITLDPIPWSPGRRKRITKKERYGDSVDVGPLAVEPTDDGVAAVLTVMVQLPGGGIGNMAGGEEGPTHRLALGSSLCLMARIYPPASRPFHLRRRTSHMAA